MESARFMYENDVMAGYKSEEGICSALKHGTLAIGMLGMAEALQLLIGCNNAKPEGMVLAKRICQLYTHKCNELKNKYIVVSVCFMLSKTANAKTNYSALSKVLSEKV